MSDAEQRHAPGKRWSLAARIYLLGAVILAAGWFGGVLIYLSDASDEASDLAYGPGWQRQYDFQLERIGGKAAVLAAEFSQWSSDLCHGRQLAYTVAILCTGIAFLCFFVAREISLAAHRDD